MLRDFRDNKKDLNISTEKVRELIQAKSELELRIAQDIANYEDRYKVIIDRVRFSRNITRTPSTIYTELSILVE